MSPFQVTFGALNRTTVLALLTLWPCRVTPLEAQIRPEWHAEAGVFPVWRWRGIKRSDSPTAHLALAGALVTRGTMAFSVGGSSEVELRRADGIRVSGLREGHRGVSEWSLWLQAEMVRPGWTVAGSLIRTEYTGPEPNTSVREVFGRLERLTRYGTARAEVWYDLSKQRGGYAELSWSMLLANPFTGPLVTGGFSLTGGYKFGTTRVFGVPGHAHNGFTHADLAFAVRLSPRLWLLDLDLDLAPHLQLSRDNATIPPQYCLCRARIFPWLEARVGIAFPGSKRQ